MGSIIGVCNITSVAHLKDWTVVAVVVVLKIGKWLSKD